METLIHDVRHGVRMLAKSPGFTAMTAVTLGLGIGFSIAIFSVVDAALFRPLPVDRPEDLVRVFASDGQPGDLSSSSYPVYADYRDQADAFSGIAAYADWCPIHLSTGGSRPERLVGALVTGSYFEVLGVRPLHGRLITVDDDRAPGAHPIAVLGHRLWKRRFGADPSVVGGEVRLNGRAFTVVGVAPRGFAGVSLEEMPEIWVPMAMWASVLPEFTAQDVLTDRRVSWLDMVARLKPGFTMAQAQAQVDVIARRRADAQPPNQKDRGARLVPAAGAAFDPGHGDVVQRVSWLLIAAVALVLLVACADAAGLLLVRAEQRQGEIAVRMALGASQGRIVRHVLAESLLLAVMGAAAGVLVAAWVTDTLMAVTSSGFPVPFEAASPLSGVRVIGFTCGLAALASLLCGLTPAMGAARTNLMLAMRSAEGHGAGGSGRHRLRGALVAAQVALSAVLLVGAGLLVKTLRNASTVNLGFNPDGAVVASVDLARQGYDEERGRVLYENLLDGLRTLPGVKAAGLARHVPVQAAGMRTSVDVEGYAAAPGEVPNVDFNVVTPGYLSALGAGLIRGRDISASDSKDAPRVAVINKAMADRFWPGQDPIGKVIRDFGPEGLNVEVIGLVADTKQHNVREGPVPVLHVPLAQVYMPRMTVLLRTDVEPRAALAAVASTLARLDGDLPLYGEETLREHAGATLAQERIFAGILSAFGLLALALAAAGLYALVSYATRLRTREFGIRIALGARRRDILRLALEQGGVMLLAATGLGLGVALALSRLLESLLFGVTPADPSTYAAVAAVLPGIGLLACYLPARRATRVDPVSALRHE